MNENFDPLKIEIPGISLEELQQFVGAAQPRQSRKGLISVSLVAAVACILVIWFNMIPNSIIRNDQGNLAAISPRSPTPQLIAPKERVRVPPSLTLIHHAELKTHSRVAQTIVAANSQPLALNVGLSQDETSPSKPLCYDITTPVPACLATRPSIPGSMESESR
jgi:hypothetical protein